MTSELGTLERDPARAEVIDALRDGYHLRGINGFVNRLGMRGLNWIISQVLDRHYPLDVFPQEGVHYGMTWGGEHGGDDIDPGVKWIAHLREALKVSDAQRE